MCIHDGSSLSVLSLYSSLRGPGFVLTNQSINLPVHALGLNSFDCLCLLSLSFHFSPPDPFRSTVTSYYLFKKYLAHSSVRLGFDMAVVLFGWPWLA